jgi:hypothetical protein
MKEKMAEAHFKALSQNSPEETEEDCRILNEDSRSRVRTELKYDTTELIHSARMYCVVSESQTVNLALRVTSAGGQNLEYIKRHACYDYGKQQQQTDDITGILSGSFPVYGLYSSGELVRRAQETKRLCCIASQGRLRHCSAEFCHCRRRRRHHLILLFFFKG